MGDQKIQTKCPVDAFLKIIGQKWNAYILHILLINGPQRFGTLKKCIPGISQKVLTEKLRELEEAKMIYRDYQPTIPPAVTYGLSDRGIDIIPLLKMVSETAHRWRMKGYL